MILEKRINKLEQENNELKQLLLRVKKQNTKINDKLLNIVHTRNHYLRSRMPDVLKRQAEKIKKWEKHIDKMRPLFKTKIDRTKGTEKEAKTAIRYILLVTSNQSQKLKHLLDMDFRPIINSKLYRDAKKKGG